MISPPIIKKKANQICNTLTHTNNSIIHILLPTTATTTTTPIVSNKHPSTI